MLWIFILIIFILSLVIVFVLATNRFNAGEKLIEKADLIQFGMSKEEVFDILEHQEPREITRNVSKGTERYRWSAGQNRYNRYYYKGMSTGSISHGRRHLTVVFKDGKVIEVSVK